MEENVRNKNNLRRTTASAALGLGLLVSPALAQSPNPPAQVAPTPPLVTASPSPQTAPKPPAVAANPPPAPPAAPDPMPANGEPVTPKAPMAPVLANYKPVTADRLTHPPDDDWLMFRRTYNGWGYSPLAQITPANAGHLKLVWTMTTGQLESHQTTPIVNDSRMFVATPRN